MVVKTKLRISLALLTMVLIIGIIGYTIISNETFIDSLYMTVITMSTVGFGTLHELNQSEKLFTIVLIILSISIYGYSVTALTEYFANDNFFQLLKYKKMQQKIQKLKNHTVVCGYGRNGRQAVLKLKIFNKSYLVVEKNKEILRELDNNGILYVEGDATDDETLNKAAIKNANSLITALPSDADNLFVVLSARQINKEFTIISRASNESSFKKLLIAGATNVIMPDKIGGDHMASLVVTPNLVEFVERLTISNETSTNLEEIEIKDLPEELINKTILDLDLRKRTGCLIIGFKTADHKYVINPDGYTKLTLNSSLIVLGKPNQIEKLHQIL
ncbi:MAG: potassium channel protein [Lutibacter sp.]|uniref:potassium channel family protein n=1 Tax=Lutibacter sp. TaxID=1925666 RepID=UPI00385A19D1